MFEKFKESRKKKVKLIEKIDKKIEKVGESESKESAGDLVKLVELRRKTVLNGVDANDLLKVVANVAVVGVIVGFEMYSVMNAKAARFIKTL